MKRETKRAISLLVIEDSEDDARMVVKILQRAGFKVQHEIAGTPAATQAALERQAWDAVISDYNMPYFNGLDALALVRKQGLDIPFILISGAVGEEIAVDALKAGVGDYVLKKNLERLPAVLERELREAAIRAGFRRTEEELHRFKLAMDNSADIIFITDRATMRHVEFNETACKLLGYSREELLGMGPQDLLPVGRAELEKAYDAMIADPSQSSGMQSYYRCKDGSQQPFESTRHAMRSGERWLIVAIARDIRRRVAAGAALRESEERYRTMFERAAVGITHTDLDGKLIMVNPKFCEITGYTPEQVLGLSFRDLTHPDDVATGVDFRARLLAGEIVPVEREARVLRKGGSYVWTNVTTSLVRAADGSPAYFMAILHDITERRRAAQELKRFGMAMDVSADSIYLTDPVAMRFVYLNATACQRLGYTREELLHMGPQDVLPIGREQIKREYDEVIAAGERGLIHERRFVRSDSSEGWTELHRRALSTDTGTLIITIGRDISERRATDARIGRLNRVYAVLSGVNSAIVRIRERGELFREICRIAVSEGGFIVARVLEMDANKIVRIAATSESDPSYYQRLIDGYNADPAHSQSLIALALHSGQPLVSNDVASDARIPDRLAATRDGNYALALLPFKVAERVAGAVVLRARAAGVFTPDELRLLNELVGNLTFALELMDKQQKLDYLAYYDALTGLANRHLLLERLSQSIRAASPAQGKLAIVLVDLERMRTINESLGRQAGDALLREVAQRLAATAGHGEVARIGVDNFAIVLQGVKGKSEVTRRIERLWQDCFGKSFRLGDADIRVSAKAGVALHPNDGADAETLLGNAEAALRRAKRSGERHVFHALEMTARTGEKLTLENSLRQALEKDEFVLHYQPKVDLVARRIVAVEALIRWQSPELGLVPPGKFIPLMEETGLILEAGVWALGKAVSDHARWQGMGIAAPRIAVNVSAIQLRRRDFVATVEQAIRGGSAPTGIDLEVTESLLMQDIEGNIEKLKAIRALGLSIAIDDFGTGYSSLGYLAKLPIQTLKIDRSFIIAMLTDPDTMTLVSTIISLAHSLRLNVVAEGVELEEQAKVLRLLRCDEMQGYLFSRPVPFEQMTALLAGEAAKV